MTNDAARPHIRKLIVTLLVRPAGCYVVFSSSATNLIDLNGDGVIDPDDYEFALDIYVHDRSAGSIELASVTFAWFGPAKRRNEHAGKLLT